MIVSEGSLRTPLRAHLLLNMFVMTCETIVWARFGRELYALNDPEAARATTYPRTWIMFTVTLEILYVANVW